MGTRIWQRGTAAAVAVALLATLVVARAGGPPGTEAAPAPLDLVAAPAEPEVAPLAWEPCTDERDAGLDCATALVPLDHGDPTGTQIGLYVTRLAATGTPGERIGTLFVNPGGPGGSVYGLLGALQPGFSPAIRAAFDIVSLNPRGVIGSTPSLVCEPGPPTAALPAAITLETAEDWTGYFTLARPTTAANNTSCQLANARTGRSYGTNQVVEDLDHLRRAVGDDELNYWGISYGSRIGGVYAQRYPDRIRAMVLDGVLEPSLTWYQTGFERGGSYDDAWAVYRAALPAAGVAFDEVLAAIVDGGPVPVLINGSPQDLDASTLLGLTQGAVGRQGRWRWLETQLVAVQAQLRGGATAELTTPASSPSSDGMFTQVGCLDTIASASPERAGRDAAAMVADGPLFGWMMADGLDQCAGFTIPTDEIPMVPPPASALAPVLLVSSVHDPATPYRWAQRANEFFTGSRLLTYEGTQHGVWTRASSCIDAHVDAYWLAGVLPAEGTTCPLVVPAPGAPAEHAIVPDTDQ